MSFLHFRSLGLMGVGMERVHFSMRNAQNAQNAPIRPCLGRGSIMVIQTYDRSVGLMSNRGGRFRLCPWAHAGSVVAP